jgi:hypothetical protein
MRSVTDRRDIAALQRALLHELGLHIPFSAEEYRAALEHARVRHGTRSGGLPLVPCTQQRRDGTFVIPVPDDLSMVEEEHRVFHQLAHVFLNHARPGKSLYSAVEERAAEAFADAMMARGLGTAPID